MKIKIILVLLLSTYLSGCRGVQKPDYSPKQAHISVVTYNINWGMANPEVVVDYLFKIDSDIVCLQETHRYWESILRKRLAVLYPYMYFKEWTGAGGIALMSKYKINETIVIEPDTGWFPALLAKIDGPIGKMQILNLHLRPPLSDKGSANIYSMYNINKVHLNEIQKYTRFMDVNVPSVITGDFNEDETGAAIQWLIAQGYEDSLSVYDRHSKTWVWPIFPLINLESRYDHILYTHDLNCVGARVDKINVSDHMPVLAVIVQYKENDI